MFLKSQSQIKTRLIRMNLLTCVRNIGTYCFRNILYVLIQLLSPYSCFICCCHHSCCFGKMCVTIFTKDMVTMCRCRADTCFAVAWCKFVLQQTDCSKKRFFDIWFIYLGSFMNKILLSILESCTAWIAQCKKILFLNSLILREG
jgi:hypothetical protein